MLNEFRKELLTKATIRELITYDPISGKAYWNRRDAKWFAREKDYKGWNARFPGREIASTKDTGYIQCWCVGNHYPLHHLIWLYMTGEWPNCIDHINGVRTDNRWGNLRNVTIQENGKNTKLRSDNKSGYHGVSWYKSRNKWMVRVNIDGVSKHSAILKH